MAALNASLLPARSLSRLLLPIALSPPPPRSISISALPLEPPQSPLPDHSPLVSLSDEPPLFPPPASSQNGHQLQQKSPFFPKRRQDLELVCESLVFKGKGMCKVADTGFVVFCDKALPGERFVGRISKMKGSYAEAVKVRTITPHHNAVIAPCVYATDCGGCKMQNLAYEAQLAAKEQQVYELISHLGRFSSGESESYMRPIIGCESQFHYRNKMEFSFGTRQWRPKAKEEEIFQPNTESVLPTDQFALGLHVPRRFDKVLSIEKCLLQDHAANLVLEKVHEYCKNHISELRPYDVFTHKGFLKHLMIRSGRVSDGKLQLMVNFVTSAFKPELLRPLIHELLNTVPEVVSIVNNVNSSIGNTSYGEQEHVLHGSSTIMESLCDLTFEISANSFFQTNSRQAEILYRLVEEAASLQGDGKEVVLDLFCGTGTIGLTLARKVRHVYGYEVVPEAVADACRNASRNGISNATFIQGDLNKITKDFGNEFPQPDVVITDPNRPGMHIKLITFLLKLRANRIIYVSCNPATCARDLDYLCHGLPGTNSEGAYKLSIVQPVDMFPHTPHIECVCSLELIS